MISTPVVPLQAGSVAQLAGSAVQPAMLYSVHEFRRCLASEVPSGSQVVCVCVFELGYVFVVVRVC